MLAFLLQINAWTRSGQIYLFAVFMLWIWVLWLLRVILAANYQPWQGSFTTTTSVIVPVVDEPVELFRTVLSAIVEQRPTETIVVINGARNEELEQVCRDLGVRWAWTSQPGKRRALQVGVGLASGEIAVLVDSDTMWTPRTLREILKPFADSLVGGVTTRQRILRPGRSILTRWADWLENVRNEYSMPAMSVLGTVGCLPGRTIAFRRKILVDHMDQFLTDRFLGVLLEVSDDRALTNYALKAGYRTVFQSTSLVYTDAPTRLGKLVRQQYRWGRGSQYNTLRMLPWMLRNAPVLALLYASDILVPFVLVGSLVSWGVSLSGGRYNQLYQDLPLPAGAWSSIGAILALTVVMTMLSMSIRFGRHFAYRPSDLVHLPAFILINTFLLMPIRVLAFFRMAHDTGWGTRSGGFTGVRQRSVLMTIPYLLGTALMIVAVMFSV
jgi:hyaluronan synthase